VKRWLLGMGIAAAAVAALYAATLADAGVHCEACVSYEGRDACKSATGPSRDEAERAAIATACALVTGGVTQTIACQGLEPVSLDCREP
jgi:hypothetical protein